MKTHSRKSKDNDLWGLLNQTQHVLERTRAKELDEAGLSSIQAEVLSIIKSTDAPVYPSSLSRKLFREPHTVSGLLTRMENQGLVKKVKDMDRRNMIRVTLTKKGEEAYKRQQQVESRAISESLSCLSEKEKDVLMDLLKRVRENGLEELRQKQKLAFE